MEAAIATFTTPALFTYSSHARAAAANEAAVRAALGYREPPNIISMALRQPITPKQPEYSKVDPDSPYEALFAKSDAKIKEIRESR